MKTTVEAMESVSKSTELMEQIINMVEPEKECSTAFVFLSLIKSYSTI